MRLFLPLLCLLAACAPVAVPANADFSGKVVGVSDGDTLTVLRGRETVRVRLHGVDTPETAQPFGSVAKKRTSDLVFGKIVTVEIRDTDQYGRMVGWVTFADAKGEKVCLNETLVADGCAWWYRYYAPRESSLKRAEGQARKAKRGLWSAPNPIAPWDWRKRDRVQAA